MSRFLGYSIRPVYICVCVCFYIYPGLDLMHKANLIQCVRTKIYCDPFDSEAGTLGLFRFYFILFYLFPKSIKQKLV